MRPGCPLLRRVGVPGRVHRAGRGRPGIPATTAASSSPGAAKLEWRGPGWGLVGTSAVAATELTVAGDVVVPGRVAGGPRGAAELQEKCQVVEGAQRYGERGPHGARSGRGRRRLTSGPQRPQTPHPPSPDLRGLAARLRQLPLARCPRPGRAPSPHPAPAQPRLRGASARPAGRLRLRDSSLPRKATPRCRRTLLPPPASLLRSLLPSLLPPGAGGGGICRLIYHQSFAQAGIFKAVPATFPRPSAGAGPGWGGESHPRDGVPAVPAKHDPTGFSHRNTVQQGEGEKPGHPLAGQRAQSLLTLPAGRGLGQGPVGLGVRVR